MHDQFFTSSKVAGSGFGILRLMAKSNNLSVSELCGLIVNDEIMRTMNLIHYHRRRHIRLVGKIWSASEEFETTLSYQATKAIADRSLDLQIMDFMKHDQEFTMYRETKIISVIDNSIDVVPPLVIADPVEWKYYAGELASKQL